MIKLTRQQSIELYNDVTKRNDFKAMRLLAQTDLFYLLLIVCKRYDINRDWLYERVREVEADPDGYLDLWSREHYKDLDVKTPVLTKNRGWVAHGDLNVGDYVFSPEGNPVKVLAKTPVFNDSDCYEMTFSDGYKIVAGFGHEWTVRVKSKHRINKTDKRKVVFTDKKITTGDIYKNRSIRWDVGTCSPVKYEKKSLPIHPYLLGVWLGDGHSSCGRITNADSDVFNKIESLGYKISICDGITKNVYGIMPILRKIGVLNNKHIPEIYLRSDVDDRIELLRGLMDSDGHCNTRGTATFVNQNGLLASQVYELANCLALRARIRKYTPEIYPTFWQVSFQAKIRFNPFSIARKAIRAKKDSHYDGVRTVRSIKRIDCVDTNCIQVEGGRYIASEALIPTNNSTIITFGKTLQDIINNPEITVGIFSHTSPIAKAFLSQIKRELETNTMLQDLFPDILYKNPQKDSPKWSTDAGIIVQRKSNPKEATVEAHGLVDGQPTSRHFNLMIYDDVVTKESVSTPEMIAKVTEAFSLSLNLAGKDSKKRYIGTRYHCLVGGTRVLMGDWSHKAISDVKVGDFVVGWRMVDKQKSGTMRQLIKSRVLNVGLYRNQKVNRYSFDCGRSVTSTPDHKWWRGPHGGGSEYKELGLEYHKMKSVRRLLDPSDIDESREAGWLSGFFDGEGSVRKNPKHASGGINITQTNKYPEIIKQLRDTLETLSFEWVEDWNKHENPNHRDVCMFKLLNGWREVYRFLSQIRPSKRSRIEEILFARLKTDKVNLISIDGAGEQDVYWIETETGNYVAEGFCSKNSNDTYKTILDRGTAKPRIYPATEDGTFKGKPVLFTQQQLDEKVRDMGSYIAAAQLLLNPLADKAQGFQNDWLMFYEVLRNSSKWNYYILVDAASEKKKTNDYTVISVIGLAPDKNYYLVDAVRDRINLTERTKILFDMVRKWEPLAVGYERYGMQSDIEHIKYVQEQEGFHYHIIELGGQTPKNDRIRRLVPIFEQHRFYMPRRLLFVDREGKARDFIKELLNDEYESFPVCTHDDMLDCISRIVDEDLEAVFPMIEENIPLSIAQKSVAYDPFSLSTSPEPDFTYAVSQGGTTPWRQKGVHLV